ncbi:MAG: hypothetical protein J6A79_00315 [Clostridia bacterium]|nr:hypothetical protein [Clostridia bacterium]
MLKEAGTSIVGYFANLGLDLGKQHFTERVDEKKLKESLQQYIIKQEIINFDATLGEEIDFEGFSDYVLNELSGVALTRIFDPSSKKRGIAREQIANAACAFAKATEPRAKYRVVKMINTCFDIIHDYYVKQFSMREYAFVSTITEAVSEEITGVSDALKVLQGTTDQILKEVKTPYAVSLEKVSEYVKSGNIDVLAGQFREALDVMSLYHPLKGNYGYDFKDGNFVSKPLTEEAIKQHPPKIIIKGRMRVNDQYYDGSLGNPLLYSYRHQCQLIIDVESAQKFLGDTLDRNQSEAEGMVNRTLIITPPSFPEAIPCSLKAGEETFYDYILLRLKEIDEKGCYIFYNEERQGPLGIELYINPADSSHPDIQFELRDPGNQAFLKYSRFLLRLFEGDPIHIYRLIESEDYFAGVLRFTDNIKESEFEETIDLFERICDIENHFDVALEVGESLDPYEHRAIYTLSDLIRGNEVCGKWSRLTAEKAIDAAVRATSDVQESDAFVLSCVVGYHANLLNAEFDYDVKRTYRCVHFDDWNKLKRKIDALDDGDPIKISFVAGEDNTYVDKLVRD